MKRHILLLELAVCLLVAAPVEARNLIESDTEYVTADTTISTTTDTVVATSPTIPFPGGSKLVCITCSGDMTTSANSTTYQTNINRGTTAAGTDVGTKVAENIKVTAAGTEAFYRKACEVRSELTEIVYNCSITMAGATGNTTVNEATITVEILE